MNEMENFSRRSFVRFCHITGRFSFRIIIGLSEISILKSNWAPDSVLF